MFGCFFKVEEVSILHFVVSFRGAKKQQPIDNLCQWVEKIFLGVTPALIHEVNRLVLNVLNTHFVKTKRNNGVFYVKIKRNCVGEHEFFLLLTQVVSNASYFCRVFKY